MFRPLPEIKWNKKGSFLPNDIEYDNYGKTLKINNVDFEDEGNYDCVSWYLMSTG